MPFTKRFTLVRPLLCLIGLLLLAGAAQAQWAWRDKDGQVTASDRPPPKDVPEKDVIRRPNERRGATTPAVAAQAATPSPGAPASGAASAPAGARTSLEAQVDAKKKAAEQEQAAKTKAEEEKLVVQRADNCRRARSQAAALDSGQRMARVNEKGEREVLDDKVRAEETRRAREVIAAECR